METQVTDYGDGNDYLSRLKAEQAEKRRLEQMPSRKMTMVERFAESGSGSEIKGVNTGMVKINELKEIQKPKNKKNATTAKVDGKKKQSSEYWGVSKIKATGEWSACMKFQRKRHVKTCNTELGAAKAYDLMSIQYRGRNGRTNFPIENYTIPPTAAELEYEDRDVVISTSCIRSAMIAYINARGAKRCSTLPNWILMEEVFFFGKSCEENGTNRDDIKKKFGINDEIHY